MLKKLLKELFYSKAMKHKGHHYGKHYSSDSYHKPFMGQQPNHNQYGHQYYKKKKHSSFFSS